VTDHHPPCDGKDRFECPCWRRGATEEAKFHTLRPATRELTEYIRAVGDADPAMNTSDMADRVYAVFHEPRLAAAPAPLDDDGWQERGNPGDDATPAPLDVDQVRNEANLEYGGALSRKDLLDLIDSMSKNPPTYRPRSAEFVHPTVYRQRAECPLWTNTANPEHRHNRDCA